MAKQKIKTGKRVAKKAPAKKTLAKKKKAASTLKKKPIKKSSLPAKNKKRKPETLMCFLTTACVNYYSLPDDGYELTTLRNYRDSYLAASKGGKNLITEYYRVSPEIIKRVEEDREKRSVYAYIYSEIRSACEKIEKQELLPAKHIYMQMVKTLMKRYHLN